MMTHEDMLRELELLPVWQSRQVVSPIVEQPALPNIDDVAPPNKAVESAPAVEALYTFRCVTSTDAQWAFILEQQHSDEAEALFQNMLKAVAVKVKADVVNVNMTHLNQYAPKVVVVMGEVVAQSLLNETQALDQIRGKTHAVQTIPTIVTYSPMYLLANVADKAKAWEDLCLAKLTVAHL